MGWLVARQPKLSRLQSCEFFNVKRLFVIIENALSVLEATEYDSTKAAYLKGLQLFKQPVDSARRPYAWFLIYQLLYNLAVD